MLQDRRIVSIKVMCCINWWHWWPWV